MAAGAVRVNYGSLSRDWEGRSVYIVGGGPSLKAFDFDRLKGRGLVVCVNDAFLHVPWADCVFSIDTVWLRQRGRVLRQFSGEKVAAVPPDFNARMPGFTFLRRLSGAGFTEDMGSLWTGDNSGFGALHMALQRGASKVALLGFDLTAPGHWHKGYEWTCRTTNYAAWVSHFAGLASAAMRQGTHVINCNPLSGIRCFVFGEPEDIAE